MRVIKFEECAKKKVENLHICLSKPADAKCLPSG